MKKAIAVLVLSCAVLAFGQGGNSATEEKLGQMENDLWAGWKAHNVEPFKKVMGNGIDVTADGISGAEDVYKMIASTDCNVNSFAIEKPTFKWLDKNSVLMVYKATQDATCGSQKLPGAVWASSLWVKKGKDWMAVFHQETPASEKM